MTTDDLEPDEPNWSRRTVLRVGGAGAGIAGLAGVGLAARNDRDDDGNDSHDGNGTTTRETTGTTTPTEATPTGTPDDGDGTGASIVDDLIDPVFGYPLGSGEAEGLSIEPVVELVTEEGRGAHENFPLQPDPETEGAFAELPAEFYFDPVGLRVEPGAVVHFPVVTGLHTVTAFHEKYGEPGFEMPTRIPDDAPGFTSPPLAPDEGWVYAFPERGVYDVLCLPHLDLGMVMRVVVIDPDEDDVEDDAFAAPTAGELSPNVQSVLGAPELEPSSVVEQGTVAWGDLTIEPPGGGGGGGDDGDGSDGDAADDDGDGSDE